MSESVSKWLLEPTLLMWLWRVKIPTEFFTDVTLAIGDICGDDVWGGDRGGGYGDNDIEDIDNWSKSGSDMPSALVMIFIVIMMQGSSC